jgi:hypothetical protein
VRREEEMNVNMSRSCFAEEGEGAEGEEEEHA